MVKQNLILLTFKNLKKINEQIAGFNIVKINPYTFFISKKTKSFDLEKPEEILKLHQGVVVEIRSSIKIYTDLYRSIPLFYKKTISGETIISSDINLLLNQNEKFDNIGIWENILFGISLHNKTLYENIHQIPASSFLEIDNKKHAISKYYNFNIDLNSKINTWEKAEKALISKLNKPFSNLDSTNQYLMGLSGGLDSKLSLLMLMKNKIPVELITYGDNKDILEYQLSVDLALSLGYEKPTFYEINKSTYDLGLNDLIQKSNNQIGMQHAHLYSYLSKVDISNKILISNFISDGIFGYACNSTKARNKNSNYMNTLLNFKNHIPNQIFEGIYEDIEILVNNFEASSNFSDINEYLYLTEKTHKFHSFLAYIYGEFIPNELIYSDFELLEFMISLNIKFRERKEIIFRTIERLLVENKIKKSKSISSVFPASLNGFSKLDFLKFKSTNYINTALLFANKNIQIKNKFVTENQKFYLWNFKQEYYNSLNILREKEILNTKSFQYFNNMPLKAGFETASRFQIIGLAKILN